MHSLSRNTLASTSQSDFQAPVNSPSDTGINQETGEASIPSRTCAPVGAGKGGALKQKLQEMDIVRAFTKGKDQHLRTQLFGSDAPGATRDTDEHVPAMKNVINSLEGLDAVIRQELSKKFDNITARAKSLKDDKPLAFRIGATAALGAALAPWPILLPLLTAPQQLKFSAVVNASEFKTALFELGMMGVPTMDKHALVNIFKNRHLQVFFESIFLLPSAIPAARHWADTPWYSVIAGLMSIAGNVAAFYQEPISKSVGLKPNPENFALPSDERTTRQILKAFSSVLKAKHAAITKARDDLKAGGDRLSDVGNRQVSELLMALDAAQSDIDAILGEKGNTKENKDRAKKYALAFLTAALCFGTAALFYDNPVGLVNLLVDAVFASVLMVSIARNSNKDFQDAADTFKQWTGLSLAMLLVFGVNKLMKDPIEQHKMSYAAATIALSAINVTLPGIVANLKLTGTTAPASGAGEADPVELEMQSAQIDTARNALIQAMEQGPEEFQRVCAEMGNGLIHTLMPQETDGPPAHTSETREIETV